MVLEKRIKIFRFGYISIIFYDIMILLSGLMPDDRLPDE